MRKAWHGPSRLALGSRLGKLGLQEERWRLTEFRGDRACGRYSRRLARRPGPDRAGPARALLAEVFLPRGFPHSVTADYVPYQCWDTLQALASSLSAALSTAALLRGAGVGNQEATVLAASLSWVLKDGVGMVGRILFAWLCGTSLDCHAKRWRLTADLLNDLAFCTDLFSAHLPQHLFVLCVCTSSAMRAIVGVAGGGTRMAVVRHQARRENLADVAAKDGSQETLVGIVSLLVSLLLLPLVEEKAVAVWTLFFVLTAVHLFANYKAVSSLEFDVFNETRLKIVARHFAETGLVLDVKEANRRESVLPWRFEFHNRFYGCSLSKLAQFENHTELYSGSQLCARIGYDNRVGALALRRAANNRDVILSAFRMELLILGLNVTNEESDVSYLEPKLERAGWSLDNHLLDVDLFSFEERV